MCKYLIIAIVSLTAWYFTSIVLFGIINRVWLKTKAVAHKDTIITAAALLSIPSFIGTWLLTDQLIEKQVQGMEWAQNVTILTDNIPQPFTILDVDPPKHVYVDLADVNTNQIVKHVYVGKYCQGWNNLRYGSERTLLVTVTKHNVTGEIKHTFPNIKSELCADT
jgi:uncharacterized membrane protein (DUF485 family)